MGTITKIRLLVFIIITMLVGMFSFVSANVFAQSTLRTESNRAVTIIGTPSDGDGTAPPVTGSYKEALDSKFGITFLGFSEASPHLQWIWEKLHEINNPAYTEMLRGAIVQSTGNGGESVQVGCFDGVSLRLGQYVPEDFYKFIIIHEFSHIVQQCQPRHLNKTVEHQNAFATEGPISYYAGHTEVCFPGPPPFYNHVNEDYADTIAYYFNPAAGFSSAPRSCNPPFEANPYFSKNAFPLHRDVAESIK